MKEERKRADIWVQEFQVMINSKVSIGLNRAFPYMMERFERDKASFYRARNRQHKKTSSMDGIFLTVILTG